ncbi:hypothetical protein MY04_4248 [Flammeovirga sp. MY04]|uniref:hypothetical protein n=1 Tax=Flammeovirga sp. MY04 TaxID=1191459 RepID=UPI00080639EB|nr:hypothetical protein [Flammeovirga sp. MY04]ANQ51590.1 hypothetical protein MY04_4248 [Flammeovirga sp. MY04]
MKLIITTIASLIYLLTSTAPGQETQTNDHIKHYKKGNINCVIFPSNYIYEYYTFLNTTNQRFTPTIDEVKKAEAYLEEKFYLEYLLKYRRQYFGYIDKQGNKILYINCFWSENSFHHKEWKETIVVVDDGGDHYWQIKFNLKTGGFFDLSVNGEG